MALPGHTKRVAALGHRGGIVALLVTLCACEAGAGNSTNATSINNAVQPLSASDEYSLQERCGKDAYAAFMKLRGSPNGLVSEYRDHYDPVHNKCFVLITEITSDNGEYYVTKSLYDANEMTDVASFFSSKQLPSPATQVVTCLVAGAKCKSEDEFDDLLKPYLG